MLEGANFILLKGLWDAHGVSCRAAEPIGRLLHSLQDGRFACYRKLASELGTDPLRSAPLALLSTLPPSQRGRCSPRSTQIDI